MIPDLVMESLYSSIESLVKKIKEDMLLDNMDPYSFIAPSAYDTAWLAMVPDHHNSQPSQPMFKDCLEWVSQSQKDQGFWGDSDVHGNPTVECLPATLACMVALKKWNTGHTLLTKGVEFIETSAERLLKDLRNCCPRWFAILFPAMIELAHASGIEISFSDSLKGIMKEILNRHNQIFEMEKLVDTYHYPPLLSYVEALPSVSIDQEFIATHVENDGSLFHSPSATAHAYMTTGNKDCLGYLQSIVRRCSNSGVPPTYPLDKNLIKLCMVSQLQRLGLAEHFNIEIEGILEKIYRSYMNQGSWPKTTCSLATQLYKDSLAFWLLRMQGYNVSSWSFCWFLEDGEFQDYIENNPEYFSSVMLNVYRATELMFPGEHEVEVARTFSRKLLEKTISTVGTIDQNKDTVSFLNFQSMIEQELKFPWITRLEHLEHRMWIEERNNTALWLGKAFYHRLSCLDDNKLMRLAMLNYQFRQAIYKNELEELKRWSQKWGLSEMGFCLEKTTYCYFAISASVSQLPHDSDLRMIVAKSAILITVADYFYDMEGSLHDLENLTFAVERWDAKGLSGHSKTIFDVLENLVSDIAAKHLQQKGFDITNILRNIWYKTFCSWFTEAKWSRSGYAPSIEEYIQTGMTSIATHTLTLPVTYFLQNGFPEKKFKYARYETITKLGMIIPRLLNDTQGYEKEGKEGKMNIVLLYLKENPDASIEGSVAYIKQMIEEKKKQILQHALMDGFNNLSKPCRHLHLSCLKVFYMFYYSTNRYDSNTEMLQDIQKAIYLPLQVGAPNTTLKPLEVAEPKTSSRPIPLVSATTKGYYKLLNHQTGRFSKRYAVSVAARNVYKSPGSRHQNIIAPTLPKLDFCFL